ncbi:UNVERIFIED_CONTAM: Retrovirus-related Pol polyprotein from transposon RE1 [Sesamum radiatum]|uniref:Retrovirus-related Pol polyprotein from transposon RE1 n=1 Tax=Sesamum radiatum TaxID=300843 RepID=A0AAW2NS84_SESRA
MGVQGELRQDGSVERYKAKLFAKGYNQVEGVDYFDRFSLFAKAVTIRILLAVASIFGWPVHQVDINIAFFHGFLGEDIYMVAPEGSSILFGKVYSDDGLIALLIYVDDVLITSPSVTQIADFKEFLDFAFTIKELGPAKYFLSLKIARSTGGMLVTQHKFTRDIITDVLLQFSKPTGTPLPLGIKVTSFIDSPLFDPEPYRCLVGCLLYLSFTRPNIYFAAQQLSQFMHKPCSTHMNVALHLVRYLKGRPNLGLFPFVQFVSHYCLL